MTGHAFPPIDGYRLERWLGTGGMGEVFLATRTSDGRAVAIKRLATARLHPDLIERCRNEARIQRRLRHPNIATLLDFLEVEGVPCLVMDYVDGPPLLDWAAGHGWRRRLEAFDDIARAVAYLHANGILHRDIKPDNLRLGADGRPRLLDFGIARDAATPQMTLAGQVNGTLEYLAPERLQGAPANRQTDVWALGVTLFALLTGRLPFEGATAADLLARHHRRAPVKPSLLVPDLPAACDRLVERCLAEDPARRLPDGDAVASAVEAVLAGRRDLRGYVRWLASALKARRRLAAMLAAAASGAMALALFWLWGAFAGGVPVYIDSQAGVRRLYEGDRLLGTTPAKLYFPPQSDVHIQCRDRNDNVVDQLDFQVEAQNDYSCEN